MIGAHFSLARILHPSQVSGRAAPAGPSAERIAHALAELRVHGRRSIRILDLGCGDGERLRDAAEEARRLGFVAIEGRGIDASASNVRHARRVTLDDAVTSLRYEIGEPIAALAAEHDAAADLVLLSEPMPYPCSPLGAALARVVTGEVLAAG